MWAFEWHEPDKDIVLRRGEPWFYVNFEVSPQDRPIQMIAAEMSTELQEYMDHIGGAVNFVNQTFSLFKTAQERRPQTLLSPIKR
jgi:hypothetical protein